MDTDTKPARDTVPGTFATHSNPRANPMLDNGTEHPQTSIPFSAMIDGRHFSGRSLSLVSANVSGLSSPDLDGKERIAVLRFDFGGYAISLHAGVHISRLDAETGELRLTFLDPTGEHLPTLRYLLNSHIAGDITSVDGIISLRERSASGTSKRAGTQSSLSDVIGRGLKVAATAALSLALAGIAANLIYQRIFSKDVTQLATLSAGGDPLRAVASGQISYLNPEAREGEVLYTLQAVSGTTLNITMPCDCQVLPVSTKGSTVLAGEPVVEILKANGAPVVEAVVSAEQAKALVAGDVAELHFADGMVAYGWLADGSGSLTSANNEGDMRALIAPKAEIGKAAIGSPVTVRIINRQIFAVRQKLDTWFRSGAAG